MSTSHPHLCAWLLVLGLLAGASAEPATLRWPIATPGDPVNISVAVTHASATVSWQHASATDGGLATHYVIKWQVRGGEAVQWFPEWVSVGEETMHIPDLDPGSEYAVRIAAVNTQGRAWSAMTVFSTLDDARCGMTWHWHGILDTSDIVALCGRHERGKEDDPSPRSACTASWAEYAMAGLAAGAAMSFVCAGLLCTGKARAAAAAAKAAARTARLRSPQSRGYRKQVDHQGPTRPRNRWGSVIRVPQTTWLERRCLAATRRLSAALGPATAPRPTGVGAATERRSDPAPQQPRSADGVELAGADDGAGIGAARPPPPLLPSPPPPLPPSPPDTHSHTTRELTRI